jgi:hypothetical protein
MGKRGTGGTGEQGNREDEFVALMIRALLKLQISGTVRCIAGISNLTPWRGRAGAAHPAAKPNRCYLELLDKADDSDTSRLAVCVKYSIPMRWTSNMNVRTCSRARDRRAEGKERNSIAPQEVQEGLTLGSIGMK